MRCPACGLQQPPRPSCARCGEGLPDAASPGATLPDDDAGTRAARALRRALATGPSRGALRDAARGLARLLRSGVGPVEALRSLATGGPSRLTRVLDDLATRIDEGASLAEAMGAHPEAFRPDDVAIVAAAERTGDPTSALEAIAQRHEGALAVRWSLLRHAAYPLLLLVASTLLLPLRHLVSGGVGAYLGRVASGLGGLALTGLLVGLVLPRLLRLPAVGERLRGLAWRLPWPASIWRAHARAVLYETLARQLDAGIPLYEALDAAARATGDPRVRQRVDEAARRVASGEALTTAAAAVELVPEADRVALTAGERSGTLAETLSGLAEAQAARRRRQLRALVLVVAVGLTLLVFVRVALGILGAYQELLGGGRDALERLEREMPY